MAHALLREEAPAAGLRAVGEEARVGAVHGDAEREREVALQLRRVERDEVRAVGIGHEPADLLEQPRPLEELRGQRPRRAVERRHEVQALARVRRDDPGQQAEVVVDDAGVNRLRRHVDEPRAGLPQQQQQEEEALLVRLEDGRGHVRVLERHRAHDDDRLLVLRHPLHRLPERDELLLEPVEARLRLLGVEAEIHRQRVDAHRAILQSQRRRKEHETSPSTRAQGERA